MKTWQRWTFVILASGIGSAFVAERTITIEDNSLPPIQSETHAWKLNKAPAQINAKKIHSQLQKTAVWGKQEKAAEKAPEPEKKNKEVQTKAGKRDWQLLGLLQQAEQYYVLLADKDKKVQRYQLGDNLADGGRIISIDANHVGLQLADGNTETIFLYPQAIP